MKTITNKLQKYAALIVLLACTGASYAAADPESEIYSPAEIHHYVSNGGASTVTVSVPSHYSFKTGHYVMIPNHSAEAPLPHDKYSAAYWVPYTNTRSGHWAGQK